MGIAWLLKIFNIKFICVIYCHGLDWVLVEWRYQFWSQRSQLWFLYIFRSHQHPSNLQTRQQIESKSSESFGRTCFQSIPLDWPPMVESTRIWRTHAAVAHITHRDHGNWFNQKKGRKLFPRSIGSASSYRAGLAHFCETIAKWKTFQSLRADPDGGNTKKPMPMRICVKYWEKCVANFSVFSAV